MARPHLLLSMVVKNEADRYLAKVLQRHMDMVDFIVIIDDASTDHSVDLCKRILGERPHRIIQNKESRFNHEVNLRKQQWEAAVAFNPEWILVLDADEMFETRFSSQIRNLIRTTKLSAFYFRLYDMWSDTHFREDALWKAHHIYRPFLVRNFPNEPLEWKETALHCGRFPLQVFNYEHECLDYRIQHFGWARDKDRQEKFKRYMELDPRGEFGWLDQYLSILDKQPNLVKWED